MLHVQPVVPLRVGPGVLVLVLIGGGLLLLVRVGGGLLMMLLVGGRLPVLVGTRLLLMVLLGKGPRFVGFLHVVLVEVVLVLQLQLLVDGWLVLLVFVGIGLLC
jgi:hypothetical protein